MNYTTLPCPPSWLESSGLHLPFTSFSFFEWFLKNHSLQPVGPLLIPYSLDHFPPKFLIWLTLAHPYYLSLTVSTLESLSDSRLEESPYSLRFLSS